LAGEGQQLCRQAGPALRRAQRRLGKPPNIGRRLPVQCNTVEIADHRGEQVIEIVRTPLASWPIASIRWACRSAASAAARRAAKWLMMHSAAHTPVASKA